MAGSEISGKGELKLRSAEKQAASVRGNPASFLLAIALPGFTSEDNEELAQQLGNLPQGLPVYVACWTELIRIVARTILESIPLRGADHLSAHTICQQVIQGQPLELCFQKKWTPKSFDTQLARNSSLEWKLFFAARASMPNHFELAWMPTAFSDKSFGFQPRFIKEVGGPSVSCRKGLDARSLCSESLKCQAVVS